MQQDHPYRYPSIKSIIRHVFFHGSSATTYDGIYHSSNAELDELEVPIPMVALAATAVSATQNLPPQGLIDDKCLLRLMIFAVTGARFQQASMKIYTVVMLQR